MQEMLYPTSYLKSKGLGKACALITDGRFSGGTSGLSICHVSPEAAEGGAIGLIEAGDRIAIDIPARKIELRVSGEDSRAPPRARGGEGQGRLEARQTPQARRLEGAARLRDVRHQRRARRGEGGAVRRSPRIVRQAHGRVATSVARKRASRESSESAGVRSGDRESSGSPVTARSIQMRIRIMRGNGLNALSP